MEEINEEITARLYDWEIVRPCEKISCSLSRQVALSLDDEALK